ncbi:MAG: FAD-binding domain-containing protein [Bacteroidota bacterium]
MSFSTDYQDILAQIDAVDPVKYGKTRNFADGAVTRLSPYISRGVISTKIVLDKIQAVGYKHWEVTKFIQELAWRDYWQQVWIAKGNAIDHDLKREQPDVDNYEMPAALANAITEIDAVDENINELYEGGYIHNHMRMYVAAIACNIGKSHWKVPARWMYYHLLDGDWASNALSWQWVAGANANKKYIANQDNINKYFNSRQKRTFLDTSYEAIPEMDIPNILANTTTPDLKTNLPKSTLTGIKTDQPTLIYNYYNLDPEWYKDEQVNRVLLLEPSHFDKYPVSDNCLNFVLRLAENIDDISIYVGEFTDFVSEFKANNIIYKEHPTNGHYRGKEESRDWMFNVTGYFPSFFGFWKKCERQLKGK